MGILLESYSPKRHLSSSQRTKKFQHVNIIPNRPTILIRHHETNSKVSVYYGEPHGELPQSYKYLCYDVEYKFRNTIFEIASKLLYASTTNAEQAQIDLNMGDVIHFCKERIFQVRL